MAGPENLEERLKAKLESGEISQAEYDNLYQKFEKLGILGKDQLEIYDENTVYVTGTKTIDGGKFGSVVSSGKLVVDGPMECRRLSISGSAEIDGNLSVVETSIISGDLDIKGVTKFGGSVSSTGAITTSGDVYSASKLNSSGELSIDGNIITDQKIVLEGTINCDRILSSSKVTLAGKVRVSDIIAESLQITQGNVNIEGTIRCKKVKIMEPFLDLNLDKAELFQEMEAIPPVFKPLTDTITTKFLPKVEQLVNTITGIFDPFKGSVEVGGDIIGDEIILSNVKILGDVIGDNVTLGPNVKVIGIVKYKSKINVEEYEGVEIQKFKET